MVVVGRKEIDGWNADYTLPGCERQNRRVFSPQRGDHWHVLVTSSNLPLSGKHRPTWRTSAVFSSVTSNVSVSGPRARPQVPPLRHPLPQPYPFPAPALLPIPPLPGHPKSLSPKSTTWGQRSLSSCACAGLRLSSMAPNTTSPSPVCTNASRNSNAARLCCALPNTPTAV